MRIIVDAFGGDNAPLEVIKGCLEAKQELGIDISLAGHEDKIKAAAKENGLDISGLQIIHAPGFITMEDEPMSLVKEKADSSMAVGMRALAQGEGDAFASAGNSGALVVGATTIVKRIKGIKRVTFSSLIPKSQGFFMLSDAGANVECRPEMLEQFAIMSSVYMEKVMGIKKPRVGLLNVGSEEHKGGPLQHDSYTLLKENKSLNFIGNVEGRDLPADGADVVICDGFVGNIALKVYEGVANQLMGKVKGIFLKNIVTKLAASFIMKDMRKLKQEMDYNEYGGAPIMGAKKPVFKIHGSAKAKAVKNAIRLTKKYAESGVIGNIEEAIKGETANEGHI